MDGNLVIILVAAFVVVDACVLILVLRRLRRRGEGALLEALAGEFPLLQDDFANFAGLGSLGGKQLRGNGALALTDETLVFAQWVPRRVLRIPRDAILSVDVTNTHAGRARRRMLRVRFTGDTGVEDAAAWNVRDVDAWLAALGGSATPLG